MTKYSNIEIKEELTELKILFRKSKKLSSKAALAITYFFAKRISLNEEKISQIIYVLDSPD